MSSPKLTTLLPAGRMKWLWLAIAGALGLWLVVLLLVSGPDEKKPKADAASRKPKSFDTPALEAFSNSKRPPVKSSKRLAPFPMAPDQGKSE